MKNLDQKITPFLWFDTQAEEAAEFYVSIFKNSKVGDISRYSKEAAEASGKPEGSVMVISFELEGQKFTAINGGPQFKFSGAVSFLVNCTTQDEVDWFWDKLSEGGEKGQCGWINRDKFGVTWQIVPEALGELMSDPDPEKSARVMQAMLKMTKINIAELEKAYEG
ncbi:MAG: VOC family protein [Candidatus Pacebacteria bacterium]|nr:VOC family protein [Candidatus Paceibacterota bacterium]